MAFKLVVAILLLSVAPAAAQELNGRHKGVDWVSASNVERFAWAGKVAVVLRLKGDQFRAAAKMYNCLNETLTPRTKKETAAITALRSNQLDELSALCATMLQSGLE